jgi:hypothetical protein
MKNLTDAAQQIKNRALNMKSKYHEVFTEDDDEVSSDSSENLLTPLPEKFYNYTEDFEEYYEFFLDMINFKFVVKQELSDKVIDANKIKYQIEILHEIKGYFSGFVTGPTFIYNHIMCCPEKPLIFGSKEELISFCSKLENTFLYSIKCLFPPQGPSPTFVISVATSKSYAYPPAP